MAFPVYSHKLYGAAISTASAWTTFYTVPAGYSLILRQVLVRNASGVSSSLNLGLVTPLTVHSFVVLAAGGEGQWDTWTVFDQGDQLAYFIDHQPWNLWASGQLLTLP